MRKNTERTIAKEASLTIEASLVLPIFLFMMICFLSLSALMLFQVRLKEGLHEEAKIIAMQKASDKNFSANDVKKDVLDRMGADILSLAPIEGGEGGIDFTGTDVENDQIITICAAYTSKLYYDSMGLMRRRFVQSSMFHTWRGYEQSINSVKEETDEEYVYVTDESEVYHLSRECSHIRLDITEVSASEIATLRNENGGKYHSCEHCHSSLNNGTLYITSDGDCYHSSLGCSGLKRTIMAIPISEAIQKGLRPCSRCGR